MIYDARTKAGLSQTRTGGSGWVEAICDRPAPSAGSPCEGRVIAKGADNEPFWLAALEQQLPEPFGQGDFPGFSLGGLRVRDEQQLAPTSGREEVGLDSHIRKGER